MRLLQLQRKEIDIKALKKRSALESDASIEISEPTIIMEGDEIRVIYGRLDDDCFDLLVAFQTIKYLESLRTSGLKTRSRIFGFSPRNALRSNFCGVTSMAFEHPKAHQTILEYGKKFDAIYQQAAPALYDRHRELFERIKPFWRIPGTLYTSGIVNKNNPLKYHFDAGNFKNVMSCMVVLKQNSEGGRLSVPQLDVKFNFENRSFIMFDGQALLHGVTPIKKLNSTGYRYSCVYYSLEQMKNCGEPEEEVKHVAAHKTRQARKRAGP